MGNSNTKSNTEPNYLGYTAIRQPDGVSIKMYFNGRDVSNELTPTGIDLNKVPIVELDSKITLAKRNEQIKILEKYSLFLEDHGYMDTDWRTEAPYAIDEFLGSS